MGLFFEVIIVGVMAWWLGGVALRSWRERRAERSGEPGAHDAGVWVNEARWARIVAELEGDRERGD
jgi:hypothetical protein